MNYVSTNASARWVWFGGAIAMAVLSLAIFLDLSGIVPLTDASTDGGAWTIALITIAMTLRAARDNLRRSKRQTS